MMTRKACLYSVGSAGLILFCFAGCSSESKSPSRSTAARIISKSYPKPLIIPMKTGHIAHYWAYEEGVFERNEKECCDLQSKGLVTIKKTSGHTELGHVPVADYWAELTDKGKQYVFHGNCGAAINVYPYVSGDNVIIIQVGEARFGDITGIRAEMGEASVEYTVLYNFTTPFGSYVNNQHGDEKQATISCSHSLRRYDDGWR